MKRRWFFPRGTCSWRELFLTASALKYGGVNTLYLGKSLPMSLSLGTVLYESHYVHLITSQYECVVNCLWTAQCLRVTVPLVLFAYHSLAAWELNFKGLSHLKWKKFPGRTPDPALIWVLPLKRALVHHWYTTIQYKSKGQEKRSSSLRGPTNTELNCDDRFSMARAKALNSFRFPHSLVSRVRHNKKSHAHAWLFQYV